MRAITLPRFGDADVLTLADLPVPTPGPDDVLIRVQAAGINRPDILQRQGHYAPPPGASPLPGLEVAGEIVAIGKNVSGWKIGDAVMALLPGGGYADYALASAGCCLPIPPGWSWAEAACLPEAFLTVWANLFADTPFGRAERVLIHGGSSGIGTTAIQMVRASGGTPYVTCGDDAKCQKAEALGAERAVNYRTTDFAEAFKDTGLTTILDMVGGDYIGRGVRILAPRGRHISIAAQGGRTASFDVMDVLRKRLIITGSTLRPRSPTEKAGLVAGAQEKLWPSLASGAIKPVIFQTFLLENAAEAQKVMESGTHFGKIALLMER
jgi:NADPH:quinone reductase